MERFRAGADCFNSRKGLQMAPIDKDACLLRNLKSAFPKLEKLLRECEVGEPLYRFYHQSFKVYNAQELTTKIVTALQALAPDRPLNAWFRRIVKAGTGKTFALEHNRKWTRVTRPIVDALLHARFFLEMAVRYGTELKSPPMLMPSGWAALLYLYNLR